MVLSIRPLDNVVSVNSYDVVDHWKFTEGDAPSLYFQAIDLSKDRQDQGFLPPGRRYVAASGATAQVVFDNIDDAKKVTKVATQPFSQDPSIWRVDLMPADPVLAGSVTVRIALTEGTATRRAALSGGLRVESA